MHNAKTTQTVTRIFSFSTQYLRSLDKPPGGEPPPLPGVHKINDGVKSHISHISGLDAPAVFNFACVVSGLCATNTLRKLAGKKYGHKRKPIIGADVQNPSTSGADDIGLQIYLNITKAAIAQLYDMPADTLVKWQLSIAVSVNANSHNAGLINNPSLRSPREHIATFINVYFSGDHYNGPINGGQNGGRGNTITNIM
ncbi:hypothetical protein PLEOSDRAFT_171018 [Pleurotus ostreatus PC15]|uniref:Uncharacterized protein n=1 Tax=Pleurotus ostreatus (strain PC15) TaxID=1137138 RepID=A0A067N9X9_PLEO1|nr:hypothetical protein PLEOSDRAFT_171018 [Pleurotus ostreatus PC15]